MRKSRNSRKRKIETSKALLLFTDILAVTVMVISAVAVFIIGDTSPFEYLIPAVFGLAATSHGFYYWKAKNENIAKNGNNVKEPAGSVFNEEDEHG